MKKIRFALLVAASALVCVPAFADDAVERPVQLAQAQPSGMAEAEVRKVDKEAGKVTLKHGEIKSLDMPPMTMVFRVKDPAMLDQVKAGDKIKFTAEKIGGQYTVTGVEAAK